MTSHNKELLARLNLEKPTTPSAPVRMARKCAMARKRRDAQDDGAPDTKRRRAVAVAAPPLEAERRTWAQAQQEAREAGERVAEAERQMAAVVRQAQRQVNEARRGAAEAERRADDAGRAFTAAQAAQRRAEYQH